MADELKRCSCGTWSPASAAECTACGTPLGRAPDPVRKPPRSAHARADIAPAATGAPREETPPRSAAIAAPPTAPAGFLTADHVLLLGAKRVNRLKWEDALLGLLLLLLGLRLLSETRVLPYAVISVISGIVNLTLCFTLGPSAAAVGRCHRWLSWLGIAAGAAVCLALVTIEAGREDPAGHGLEALLSVRNLWYILALFVAPVLLFPIRALEALRRIEVRAFLGLEPLPSDPMPAEAIQGQSNTASRTGATVAAAAFGAGVVGLIAVIIVPFLAMIAIAVIIVQVILAIFHVH